MKPFFSLLKRAPAKSRRGHDRDKPSRGSRPRQPPRSGAERESDDPRGSGNRLRVPTIGVL